MNLTETIVFYLLFGAGIAAAIALNRRHEFEKAGLFRIVTGVFFWPVYLPILLDRPPMSESAPAETDPASAKEPDFYAATIARVDSELESALDSLDGWA